MPERSAGETRTLRSSTAGLGVIQGWLLYKFISPLDRQFIYTEEDKTIRIARYEFECYHRIAKAINQSELFVTGSTRYNALSDELLPNWPHTKIAVIKNLGNDFLTKDVRHFIETEAKPLDQRIRDVNMSIVSGNNKFVKVKEETDGSKSWTLPYARKNAEIQNPLYAAVPNISITHLLQVVNEHTHFINEFTHIKPHYSKSKVDEMSIYGAVVANATGLGVHKMADMCDINLSDLICADDNYIRLSTLRAANDRVSNFISKLPIFKRWNLAEALLLSTADGQKMATERDTLLARHSLKYFGLEKGVVAYSLISNHVPINCRIIGANMHESHFLFDLFYNNTSIIKPDILSTDTEGSNQLNFFFLHVIAKIFAPRYRSLSAKTESIISFTTPDQFSECIIQPNRSFNQRLVLDEEDNIKHVVASLLSGEANQSNIVTKLSSRGHVSRTKQALWEMNAVLMTNHLLNYIEDVGFRQSIQGGLSRGEAYHQLRRAIEKSNGRNFRGTSDVQIAVWNECARFLTNNVICYNSLILNGLKEESDRRGDTERSRFLDRLSPVAWTHINLQGRYVFMEENNGLDVKKIVKILSDVPIK